MGRKWHAPPHWDRTRRLRLAQEGYRCQDCGIAWDPKVPGGGLSIHHCGIAKPDGSPGDPRDKRDRRRENLAVLCLACHALAELPRRAAAWAWRDRNNQREALLRALRLRLAALAGRPTTAKALLDAARVARRARRTRKPLGEHGKSYARRRDARRVARRAAHSANGG